MDLKAFLSMVFFTIVASRPPKEEDFYFHNLTDDYLYYEYDDEPISKPLDRPPSVVSANNKRAARYEVTEEVDDIPNNVVYTGPIVANFTIKLPHNNATVAQNKTYSLTNSNNEIDIDGFDDVFNGFGDSDHKVNKHLKNNSINIFKVDNKYDDHKSTVHNIYINKLPSFGRFSLKEHVVKFKDGVVDLIHNVKNSDIYNGVSQRIVVPLFDTIQRKGSVVASKLHDFIFGNCNCH